MLEIFTFGTDLIAMAVTLWMAFYLFIRGFPNRITMRAVLSLLALSAFFLGAYNNFFIQIPGTAAWRAVVLLIGLGCWYSVVFQLLSAPMQAKLRWLAIGVYLLCLFTIVALVVSEKSFVNEVGNHLYVAHMQGGFPYTLYGPAQIIISLALLFTLLIEPRIRSSVQGRFFLLATFFPVLTMVYGAVALIVTDPPMPRLIQDMFIFLGIFLLGVSVARHQSLLERRTFFQDFPATGTLMFVLVAACLGVAMSIGTPMVLLGVVAASLIVTLSLYDMGREVLERLRMREESRFRRQLSLIESESRSGEKLQAYLQEGLDKLCNTLNASAGVIAVWEEETFLVAATRNSVRGGSEILADASAWGELSRVGGRVRNIEWMASAFEGTRRIILVGIGASRTKLEYSSGDLDLLAEFSDQAGTVVSMANLKPHSQEDIQQFLDKSQAYALEMESAADGMIQNLSRNPEENYVKWVEDGLRKYQDFVALGTSTLADWMKMESCSEIERGKQVQRLLREAVEALRPSGPRPVDPTPRAWYNYAILHDAYVEGVPNRDIMARLYISEGTFNRTRRSALRGATRWLLEKATA